jgi:hypothetical protein
MAIDLFCYSGLSRPETQSLIEEIGRKHGNLFSKKFVVSPLQELDDFSIETAREHDLVAASLFLIRLADKSAAAELDDVARVMKREFGEGNLVVLFENEKAL